MKNDLKRFFLLSIFVLTGLHVWAYTSMDAGDPEIPTSIPTFDLESSHVIPIFCEQYEEPGYQDSDLGIASAGNWGQNADQIVEEVELVSGNKTLHLTNWNVYPMKIHKNSSAMDLTGMDYLHCSVYLMGELDGSGKPVTFTVWMNDKEGEYRSTPSLNLHRGEWVSVSIPLCHYADHLDLSQAYVLRPALGGYKKQEIYLDNIFAYKGEPLPGEVAEACSDVPPVPKPIQDKTDGVLPDMNKAFLGVNLASASGGNVPGSFGFDYMYPKNEDLYYYKAKGVRLLRIPFRAARVQHELNADLDFDAEKSDIKALQAVVREAERLGMWVMLDMHDFCERTLIASDGTRRTYEYGVAGYTQDKVWHEDTEVVVTKEHFADIWKKLAVAFKDYKNIWGYDLMNEPKGINIDILFDDYQAAIDAIREVDMNTPIVIEGKNYAGAKDWPATSDKLKNLIDPADKLIFQAHTYFDDDNSGTYNENYDKEVGTNIEVYKERLDPFINWLKENNKRGMLGEYGVPYNEHAQGDPRYMDLIDDVFAYLKEKQLTSTYWCGGAMYDAYILAVQPAKDYATEKSTMKVMEKYIENFDDGVWDAVHNVKSDVAVAVYPTVAESNVNVSASQSIKEIQLYNAIAQEVYGQAVVGKQATVDMSGLAKGNYLLTVILNSGERITRKISKI